jgi:Leucine-rich repeat (LRR) protein
MSSIALHYSFREIHHTQPCDVIVSEDKVEQVYLKQCDLVKVPEWLTKMTNLSHVNLSSKKLRDLPASAIVWSSSSSDLAPWT